MFLGQTTSKQYNTNIGHFQKVCQKIQIESKDEHVILGSLLVLSCTKELLNEKIAELEKVSEFVDEL